MKPFLKWAGGKSSLLPQYAPHIPADFDCYHEPFLGGGAMFFYLAPDRAVLSDANAQLINTYLQVRDDLSGLVACLRELEAGHFNCPFGQQAGSFYYQVRSSFNRDHQAESVLQAARFIYLNKAGFNGLYRENAGGAMNVPKGRSSAKAPLVFGICDVETLTACSAALAKPGVEIRCEGFGVALTRVGTSTPFVFCDPPYLPLGGQKTNFSGYQAAGFGQEDHEFLEYVLRRSAASGAIVLASNSMAADQLYSRWEQSVMTTRRSIAAKGGDRLPMTELLFSNPR